MHDETYKKLFASPRMVEDLVRAFGPAPIADQIDYTSLQRLSSEMISHDLQKRSGDTIWSATLRADAHAENRRTLYLLILLEFQSTHDHWMALRMAVYTALLYQNCMRDGSITPATGLPAALPIVVHNGDRPWRAPRSMRELIPLTDESLREHQLSQKYVLVDLQKTDANDIEPDNLMTALARIEQIQSVTDLPHVVSSLDGLLGRRPGNDELRNTFRIWIEQLAGRLSPDQPLPPSATLGELQMTLEERLAEWPKQYIAQGIAEGIAKGHVNALCQLAAAKYGPAAGTPTAEALAPLTDTHALDTAGRHLLTATSLDDFLARIRSIPSHKATP